MGRAVKCPDCGLDNIAGSDDCADCGASLVNAPHAAPKRGMERKILEGFVSDLAPRKATQVKPSDPLLKAVDVMRAERIGCVLAVENGRCAGVLSDRDLILKVSETKKISGIRVADVMHTDAPCLKAEDELAAAFHQMAVSGYLHMPVLLKDGGLGVVSARDLLKYLCK